MSYRAHILIDDSSSKAFDYLVPDHLAGKVSVGSRVIVDLRKRRATGIVLSLEPHEPGAFDAHHGDNQLFGQEVWGTSSEYVELLKPILEIIGDTPVFSPVIIDMAHWLSDYYGTPLEQIFSCFLPASSKTDNVAPKLINQVALSADISDELLAQITKKAPKQAAILRALLDADKPLPLNALDIDTPLDPARSLVKKGLITLTTIREHRDPEARQNFTPSVPLTLNDEQSSVLTTLTTALTQGDVNTPFLLHGVTGSGKTEIYLQLVAHALSLKQSALILVPEISLTPQIVQRFKSRFTEHGHIIAILHSHLSEGERFDEWQRIHRGDARIVIGARSAVFAPIQNLGLIIVDEEHDNSYKQESAPRYHGRNVAVLRGHLEHALVLLGSATPSLESAYNVKREKYRLLTLTKRIIDRPLPRIHIVDMGQEKQKNHQQQNGGIISDFLRAHIDSRLARNEQILLLLNRRGFSRSIQCPDCGFVLKCPHCDLALTYHRSSERVICHICGHQAVTPKACPECKSTDILFQGYGTQKVESILRALFPDARIARIDADVSQRKHAIRTILNQFKSRSLDILLGTQMIAKGLDFPGVTLVGVLNADTGLSLPDFRAAERTFQLLTQVAGRAGRGELPGEVILQTFTPHASCIQFARHHDVLGFNTSELEMRRLFNMPPYSGIVLVTARSEHEQRAELTLQTLARLLESNLPPHAELSPVLPAPIAKTHGQFRFQITLKHPSTRTLSHYVSKTLAELTLPHDVTVTMDVDPISFL